MTTDPPLEAVLWDMDGTLVDTESHWMAAEFSLVAQHGGSWSTEHALQLVGNDLRSSAEYIRINGGVDLGDAELIDELQRHVIDAMSDSPPWRPGALELLSALRQQGVRCALVTMSWSSLALTVASLAPAGSFEAVITGDMVAHGKPDPEPYLTALDRLGVPATRVVAIEDSITGTTAAVAAGLPTLVVPHVEAVPSVLGTRHARSLVDVGVDDLRSLL